MNIAELVPTFQDLIIYNADIKPGIMRWGSVGEGVHRVSVST